MKLCRSQQIYLIDEQCNSALHVAIVKGNGNSLFKNVIEANTCLSLKAPELDVVSLKLMSWYVLEMTKGEDVYIINKIMLYRRKARE